MRVHVLAASLALVSFVGLGAAIADDHPCPGPHPPPEALAACDGKESGDACSVALPDRTLNGTCLAPPGKRLACIPEGAPPPPQR
jgi:hypothetical protein